MRIPIKLATVLLLSTCLAGCDFSADDVAAYQAEMRRQAEAARQQAIVERQRRRWQVLAYTGIGVGTVVLVLLVGVALGSAPGSSPGRKEEP